MVVRCKSEGMEVLFKKYFDVAYFLCISPFRLIRNVRECNNCVVIHYTIREPRWHSVICGINTFLILSFILRDLWNRLVDVQEIVRTPVGFFEVAYAVIHLIALINSIKQFWFDKVTFRNIFNFIVNTKNRNLLSYPSSKGTKFIKFLIIFYGILALIGNGTAAMVLNIDLQAVASPQLWKEILETRKVHLFFSNQEIPSNSTCRDLNVVDCKSEFSIFERLLAWISRVVLIEK